MDREFLGFKILMPRTTLHSFISPAYGVYSHRHQARKPLDYAQRCMGIESILDGSLLPAYLHHVGQISSPPSQKVARLHRGRATYLIHAYDPPPFSPFSCPITTQEGRPTLPRNLGAAPTFYLIKQLSQHPIHITLRSRIYICHRSCVR